LKEVIIYILPFLDLDFYKDKIFYGLKKSEFLRYIFDFFTMKKNVKINLKFAKVFYSFWSLRIKFAH